MEVYVDVKAEHLGSGEIKSVSEGYFVMVALDRNGRPTAVPPLRLESEEDRQCFAEAKQRIAGLKSEARQLTSKVPKLVELPERAKPEAW